MMAHVIHKARIKQRSVIITLLDLKNAVGEVHHNLIKSVLAHHHIPESVQALIPSLYTDCHSYIISDNFSVEYFKVMAPITLTCALIYLSSSLHKRSTNNLVFRHTIKMTAYSILPTGFNLRMTLLLLLLMNVKPSCYYIASQGGASGPV